MSTATKLQRELRRLFFEHKLPKHCVNLHWNKSIWSISCCGVKPQFVLASYKNTQMINLNRDDI